MSTTSHLENVAEKIAKTNKRQASDKKSTGKFDADGRRVIRHDAGRLPEIVNELAAALAEYDENLFVYMGRLFRIYPAPESPKNGIRRARGTLILHPVTSAHLIELAGLVAIHERYDVRTEGYKPCNCPKPAKPEPNRMRFVS